MKRHLTLWLLAAALVLAAAIPAGALEIPDLTRTGSIHVTMKTETAAAAGGNLALYRVGKIVQTDTGFGFVPGWQFSDCGISLDTPDGKTAAALAGYAESHGISGEIKTVNAEASVSFLDLEPGLYLLTQPQAAPGFEPCKPFLVSVPLAEDGTYRYEVDASPKVSLTQSPTEPPAPTDPTLPQTGQLNWPIPVLAALGLLCLAAGVLLRRKGGNEA